MRAAKALCAYVESSGSTRNFPRKRGAEHTKSNHVRTFQAAAVPQCAAAIAASQGCSREHWHGAAAPASAPWRRPLASAAAGAAPAAGAIAAEGGPVCCAIAACLLDVTSCAPVRSLGRPSAIRAIPPRGVVHMHMHSPPDPFPPQPPPPPNSARATVATPSTLLLPAKPDFPTSSSHHHHHHRRGFSSARLLTSGSSASSSSDAGDAGFWEGPLAAANDPSPAAAALQGLLPQRQVPDTALRFTTVAYVDAGSYIPFPHADGIDPRAFNTNPANFKVVLKVRTGKERRKGVEEREQDSGGRREGTVMSIFESISYTRAWRAGNPLLSQPAYHIFSCLCLS